MARRRINSIKGYKKEEDRHIRIVPRKNSRGHDAPHWWSGISLQGRQAETRCAPFGKSLVNRTQGNQGRAQTFAVGVPQRALRCQPRAFTFVQNEKSTRFVRHLYQQIARSRSLLLPRGLSRNKMFGSPGTETFPSPDLSQPRAFPIRKIVHRSGDSRCPGRRGPRIGRAKGGLRGAVHGTDVRQGLRASNR